MPPYPLHNVICVTKSDWELVLGSKPILDAEDDHLDFNCQLPAVSIIGLKTASNIATTMYVDQQGKVFGSRMSIHTNPDQVVISSTNIKFVDLEATLRLYWQAIPVHAVDSSTWWEVVWELT